MKRLFRNIFGGESQDPCADEHNATQDSIEYTDGSSYSYSETDEEPVSRPERVSSLIPPGPNRRDDNVNPNSKTPRTTAVNGSVPASQHDAPSNKNGSEGSHYSLRPRRNQMAQEKPLQLRAKPPGENAANSAALGKIDPSYPESAASNQIVTNAQLDGVNRNPDHISKKRLDMRERQPLPFPELPHLGSARTTSGVVGRPGKVGATQIEAASLSTLRAFCKELGLSYSGSKENLKKRALAKVDVPSYLGEETQPLKMAEKSAAAGGRAAPITSTKKTNQGMVSNLEVANNRRKTTTTKDIASRAVSGVRGSAFGENRAVVQNSDGEVQAILTTAGAPLDADPKASTPAAELSSTELYKFEPVVPPVERPNIAQSYGNVAASVVQGGPTNGHPTANNRANELPSSTDQCAANVGKNDFTGASNRNTFILGGNLQQPGRAAESPERPGNHAGQSHMPFDTKQGTSCEEDNSRSDIFAPRRVSIPGSDADMVHKNTLPSAKMTDNENPRSSNAVGEPVKYHLHAAMNVARTISRMETQANDVRPRNEPKLPSAPSIRNSISNDISGENLRPNHFRTSNPTSRAGGHAEIPRDSIGTKVDVHCSRPPRLQVGQRPPNIRNRNTGAPDRQLVPAESGGTGGPSGLPSLAPVRPTPQRRSMSSFASPADIIRTFNRYTPRRPVSSSAADEETPTPLFSHGSRPSSERFTKNNFHKLPGSAFGVQFSTLAQQNRVSSRWSSGGSGAQGPFQDSGVKRHSTGMSVWQRRATSARAGQLTDLREKRRSDRPASFVKLNELPAKQQWRRNDRAVAMASSAKKILEALKRTSEENRELCAGREPLLALRAPPSLKRARDSDIDLEKVEKRLRRAKEDLPESSDAPSSSGDVNVQTSRNKTCIGTQKDNFIANSKSKNHKRSLGLGRSGDDQLKMKRSSKRRSFSATAYAAFKEIASNESPLSRKISKKHLEISSSDAADVNIVSDFVQPGSARVNMDSRKPEENTVSAHGNIQVTACTADKSVAVHNLKSNSLSSKEKPKFNPFKSLSGKHPNDDSVEKASNSELNLSKTGKSPSLEPESHMLTVSACDDQSSARKSIMKGSPEGEKKTSKTVTFAPSFTQEEKNNGSTSTSLVTTSQSLNEAVKLSSCDQAHSQNVKHPTFTIPKPQVSDNGDTGGLLRFGEKNNIMLNDNSIPFPSSKPKQQEAPKMSDEPAPASIHHTSSQGDIFKQSYSSDTNVQKTKTDSADKGSLDGNKSSQEKSSSEKADVSKSSEVPNLVAIPSPVVSRDDEKPLLNANPVSVPQESEQKNLKSGSASHFPTVPISSGQPASSLSQSLVTANVAAPKSAGASTASLAVFPAVFGSEPSTTKPVSSASADFPKSEAISGSNPISLGSSGPLSAPSAFGTPSPGFNVKSINPPILGSASALIASSGANLSLAGPFGSSSSFPVQTGEQSGPAFPFPSTTLGASGFPALNSSASAGSSSPFVFSSSGPQSSKPDPFGKNAPSSFGSASFGTSATQNASNPFGTSNSTAGNPFGSSGPAASNNPFSGSGTVNSSNPFGSTWSAGSSVPLGAASTGSMNPFNISGSAGSSNPFGTSGSNGASNPFGSSSSAGASNPFGTSSGTGSGNPFGIASGVGSSNPFGASGSSNASNPFGSGNAVAGNPFSVSGSANVDNPFGSSGSAGNPFGSSGSGSNNPFGTGFASGSNPFAAAANSAAFGSNPGTAFGSNSQNMFNSSGAGSGGNFSMGSQSQNSRRGRKVIRARRTMRR